MSELNSVVFDTPTLLAEAVAGAQLGIFEGRGLIHEKGPTKLFKENTTFEYYFADS